MTNVITANIEESRVIIINLAISALATERQIDLSTLGIVVEELPEATKKLLREKIFPKSFLRSYNHLREQAETLVDAGGSTKTNLGAITSFSEAIEKVRGLKELKEQWEARMLKDAATYDEMVADHLLSISADAIKAGADPKQVNILVTAIQSKQPTWAEVSGKLAFSYTVTPVTLEEEQFDPDLFEAQRDSVVAIREGVLGSLVQHVCREAKEMLETLLGQEKNKGTINLRVNPRTVERARKMQAKLKSLSFVHPLIRPLHTEIAAILDTLSPSDALIGREYLAFKEILIALRDQSLVHERLTKGLPLIHVASSSGSFVAAPVSNMGPVASQALSNARGNVYVAAAQAAVTAQASTAIASTSVTTTPAPADEEETEVEEAVVKKVVPATPAATKPAPTTMSMFL